MNLPKIYATQVQKRTIDMTTSVNPLGCSPRALRALRSTQEADISTYPDQTPLISALSVKYAVAPECIILGIGSEQLIKLVSLVFAQKNIVAVESGSFFLFSREPLLLGSKIQYFQINEQAKLPKNPTLLFIANPTTPGGIDRKNDEILATIDRINPKIAVVDEANGEFRNQSLIPQTRKRSNLIVLRTFSKALGLAGLRIGFAIANANIIKRIKEFQQPFPITTPALRGALESLTDQTFLSKTIKFITTERNFLTKELQKRGFSVSNSITNNLFVSRSDAKAIILELEKRNVSVIDGSYFPGNTCIGFRISLRNKKVNRKFLQILDEALACLTKKKLLRSKENL